MFVTGRTPETSKLGIENTKVQVEAESGFIMADQDGEAERTTVPHIYAIGDVLKVAIAHILLVLY